MPKTESRLCLRFKRMPLAETFYVVIFLLLTFSLSAQSRTHKGTVIVSGHSYNKIVVAADSRSTKPNGEFTDNVCKLIGLDDHTIFTGAGFAAHVSNGVVYWNSYLEAFQAFKRAKQAARPHILRSAATDFGQHLTDLVNAALQSDPVGTMSGVEGKHLFNALFLGFENGKGAMYQVEILIDPKTRRATQLLDARPNSGNDMLFGAAGWNEVAVEVLSGKTQFAIAEQKKWEKIGITFPVGDREVRWAIKLVELSEVYGPHKIEIGGPVDAAEITAKGIRWIQRKPGCEYGGVIMKDDKASPNSFPTSGPVR